MEDGTTHTLLAHEGLSIGAQIQFTTKSVIKPGNIVPLDAIPEGTPIYNIETSPGDGGKLVRSAGTYASVVSHGDGVIIKLPSGSHKKLPSRCRATIGVVAGGGRKEKPLLKAGKKYHAIASKARKYPIVRGVAMNPVNHPHGGGHTGLGRPSTVSKGAPPGRKVGTIAAKRTGKR
jgi:large subunit ribosomal protein L2